MPTTKHGLKSAHENKTPSKNSLLLISIALGTCLLIACQSAPVTPQPEIITKMQQASAKKAITEITQTLNLSANKSWSTIIDVLTKRKITIASKEPVAGVMKTEWIAINDTLCGSYPRAGAPLSCQVRYTLRVKALSSRSSKVQLNYLERCIEHDAGPLECPDSKAEKLMLAILADIKDAGGVLD